jgi:hypothetical protein
MPSACCVYAESNFRYTQVSHVGFPVVPELPKQSSPMAFGGGGRGVLRGCVPSRLVHRCDKPNLMMGLPRCMTFGGPRVDAAIARDLLQEPMAIEAAFEAERMHREQQEDQQRILDMEMKQARYEASLAERRYAACDPDNRLICRAVGEELAGRAPACPESGDNR